MGYSYTIDIFSHLWWKCLLGCLLGIILVVLCFWRLSPQNKERALQVLAELLIFDVCFYLFYRESIHALDVATSLPLQYCSLMQIFSAIALVTRKQWFFEVTLLLGVIAPFQAIITPGLVYEGIFCFLEYFLCHSLTIATPLILLFACNMRPRDSAWWRVSLSVIPIVLGVMGINYLVGGNYMFLREAPQVDHFMTCAPWPLYIIIWAILIIFLGYIINRLTRRKTA